MSRHHINQLRFALGNHDKSRSICRLLPIYYFFEFRYDEITRQSSPGQEFFLLFGTAFCLSAISSKTCFCDIRTSYVLHFAAQSTRKLLSDIMTVPKRNGILIDKDNRQSSRRRGENACPVSHPAAYLWSYLHRRKHHQESALPDCIFRYSMGEMPSARRKLWEK